MNKKLIGNTAWYFGGTAISAILGLISSPLLTRILSTEVYAQYGLVTSFSTLVATFIYMGQDETFMRYFERRSDSYWTFLWRCMRLPLLLCLVMLFVLLEPRHTVLKWIFKTDISWVIALLLAIYIGITVIQRFLMLTARMEERAANYSISNVVTKLLFLVAVFLLLKIVPTLGLSEIIISLIIGVICALAINVLVVIKVKHEANPNGEVIGSKELLVFGLPFALSTTMFWVVPMIEKIIIRDLTDWTTLAVYTSAAIFVTAMSLIKVTTNSIWIPYVYKHYTEEKKFKDIFHNLGIVLCWLCICILAFIILTRRWLVLIFDKAYYDCRLIAPALVCGACFDLLTGIYSIGINIKKKTKFHIIVPFLQLSASMMLLFILLPELGLVATGISYLLSIAISRIVQMIIGLHLYGTGKGYTKVIVMMGMYIIIGILSCFLSSLFFDITCCFLLFIIGSVVAWKEIKVICKAIIPNRRKFSGGGYTSLSSDLISADSFRIWRRIEFQTAGYYVLAGNDFYDYGFSSRQNYRDYTCGDGDTNVSASEGVHVKAYYLRFRSKVRKIVLQLINLLFMAKKNDITQEISRFYEVDPDNLNIYISSNIIFRYDSNDEILYFRECRLHEKKKKYIIASVRAYFSVLYKDSDGDKIATLILKDLEQSQNFSRFLGLIDIYESHLKEMRNMTFSDCSLVGLPSLSARKWKGLIPFLKYCRGALWNLWYNNYLKAGFFQNFNYNRQKATRILAKVLHIEGMIPNTEICSVKIGTSDEMICSVMPQGGALSPCKVPLSERANCSAEFIRQLHILELFDALCYQVDHRMGNYNIVYGNNGIINGVIAFDNDAPLTFIPVWFVPTKTYCGCSGVIGGDRKFNRPYVDKNFYEAMSSLTFESINKSLNSYLTSCQILGLWKRIASLRNAISIAIKQRRTHLLMDDEWSTFDKAKELSGNYGMTYFKYYLEVDEINSINEKLGADCIRFESGK